jgi:hypothetical protein
MYVKCESSRALSTVRGSHARHQINCMDVFVPTRNSAFTYQLCLERSPPGSVNTLPSLSTLPRRRWVRVIGIPDRSTSLFCRTGPMGLTARFEAMSRGWRAIAAAPANLKTSTTLGRGLGAPRAHLVTHLDLPLGDQITATASRKTLATVCI